MANNETIAEREEAMVAQGEAAAAILHEVVNGDALTDVVTAAGPVPSLAKQVLLNQEKVNAALLEVASQMAGAMTYPTTAAGLLGTVNGGYFSTPSSEVAEYLILYKNVAGVAVPVSSYPSSAALNEIKDSVNTFAAEGSDSVMDIVGDDEFIVGRFLTSGALEMLNGRLVNTSKGVGFTDVDGQPIASFGATGSDINGLSVEPSSAPGVEIVDDLDFIFPGGDFSGRASADEVESPQAPVTLELNQQQVTDYMGVWGYGQSLLVGAYATPVISVTQLYGNVMIASGNKIRYGDQYYDGSAFVPLVETVRDIDGESPVTAMCNGVSRRIAEDGESLAGVFVAAAAGRGGQSVEALGPGGNGDYDKLLAQIKDHANLAKSLGKTYSVWAYVWIQGEANYSTTGSGATSTKSAYKYTQLQLEIFDGVSRELATLGIQKFRPYTFTYQVGAHRKYSSDTMQIALAQWRASRSRPDVVLAAPVYIFPVVGDNLHLTNEGSWLQGEYLSRAMKQTMIRRDGKWRPLEPVSVDWTNTYIDIKFHVPGGHLVLDSELAAIAPNFGFDIREGEAVVADLISSVSVTGSDTVRLALSRPAAADALLSYARGRSGDPTASGPVIGARGNLRDTHGLYDTVTSPLGNTFALHNPCVMFEFNRKTGF